MADDTQKDDVIVEDKTETETESNSSSIEDIDYAAIAKANEALALAEKERADAAEALILKNKAIQGRQGKSDAVSDEEKPVTRKELEDMLKTYSSKSAEDETAESKRLTDAQRNLAELKSKTAEMARALKSRDGVSNDTASDRRDGDKGVEPKLSPNSPLKEYKFEGNGIYSKKMANGKTLFVNTKASGNEQKKWVV